MSLPIRLYDPFYRPQSIWSTMERPLRLFEQNFGNGLLNDDLWSPATDSWLWPRRNELAKERSGLSEVLYDKDKYQVMLDVQHFKPEEITVKSNENDITVHGHHTEKPDEHGYISRSFTRRYILPDDVKFDHVECTLSSDGVLTLKAPRIIALKDDTERVIPIIKTGKPALKQEGGPPAGGQQQQQLQIASEEKGTCADEVRKAGAGSG